VSNTSKKGFGVYAALFAAILSAAAGVLFQMTGGVFGKAMKNYYDPMIVGLLIGALVLTVVLVVIKKYGLASLAATALPGIAVCWFFCKGAYWHFVDVFMAIDESAFDPKYIAFVALALAAFIVGEIAIYAPKTVKGNFVLWGKIAGIPIYRKATDKDA